MSENMYTFQAPCKDLTWVHGAQELHIDEPRLMALSPCGQSFFALRSSDYQFNFEPRIENVGGISTIIHAISRHAGLMCPRNNAAQILYENECMRDAWRFVGLHEPRQNVDIPAKFFDELTNVAKSGEIGVLYVAFAPSQVNVYLVNPQCIHTRLSVLWTTIVEHHGEERFHDGLVLCDTKHFNGFTTKMRVRTPEGAQHVNTIHTEQRKGVSISRSIQMLAPANTPQVKVAEYTSMQPLDFSELPRIALRTKSVVSKLPTIHEGVQDNSDVSLDFNTPRAVVQTPPSSSRTSDYVPLSATSSEMARGFTELAQNRAIISAMVHNISPMTSVPSSSRTSDYVPLSATSSEMARGFTELAQNQAIISAMERNNAEPMHTVAPKTGPGRFRRIYNRRYVKKKRQISRSMFHNRFIYFMDGIESERLSEQSVPVEEEDYGPQNASYLDTPAIAERIRLNVRRRAARRMRRRALREEFDELIASLAVVEMPAAELECASQCSRAHSPKSERAPSAVQVQSPDFYDNFKQHVNSIGRVSSAQQSVAHSDREFFNSKAPLRLAVTNVATLDVADAHTVDQARDAFMEASLTERGQNAPRLPTAEPSGPPVEPGGGETNTREWWAAHYVDDVVEDDFSPIQSDDEPHCGAYADSDHRSIRMQTDMSLLSAIGGTLNNTFQQFQSRASLVVHTPQSRAQLDFSNVRVNVHFDEDDEQFDVEDVRGLAQNMRTLVDRLSSPVHAHPNQEACVEAEVSTLPLPVLQRLPKVLCSDLRKMNLPMCNEREAAGADRSTKANVEVQPAREEQEAREAESMLRVTLSDRPVVTAGSDQFDEISEIDLEVTQLHDAVYKSAFECTTEFAQECRRRICDLTAQPQPLIGGTTDLFVVVYNQLVEVKFDFLPHVDFENRARCSTEERAWFAHYLHMDSFEHAKRLVRELQNAGAKISGAYGYFQLFNTLVTGRTSDIGQTCTISNVRIANDFIRHAMQQQLGVKGAEIQRAGYHGDVYIIKDGQLAPPFEKIDPHATYVVFANDLNPQQYNQLWNSGYVWPSRKQIFCIGYDQSVRCPQCVGGAVDAMIANYCLPLPFGNYCYPQRGKACYGLDGSEMPYIPTLIFDGVHHNTCSNAKCFTNQIGTIKDRYNFRFGVPIEPGRKKQKDTARIVTSLKENFRSTQASKALFDSYVSKNPTVTFDAFFDYLRCRARDKQQQLSFSTLINLARDVLQANTPIPSPVVSASAVFEKNKPPGLTALEPQVQDNALNIIRHEGAGVEQGTNVPLRRRDEDSTVAHSNVSPLTVDATANNLTNTLDLEKVDPNTINVGTVLPGTMRTQEPHAVKQPDENEDAEMLTYLDLARQLQTQGNDAQVVPQYYSRYVHYRKAAQKYSDLASTISLSALPNNAPTDQVGIIVKYFEDCWEQFCEDLRGFNDIDVLKRHFAPQTRPASLSGWRSFISHVGPMVQKCMRAYNHLVERSINELPLEVAREYHYMLKNLSGQRIDNEDGEQMSVLRTCTMIMISLRSTFMRALRGVIGAVQFQHEVADNQLLFQDAAFQLFDDTRSAVMRLYQDALPLHAMIAQYYTDDRIRAFATADDRLERQQQIANQVRNYAALLAIADSMTYGAFTIMSFAPMWSAVSFWYRVADVAIGTTILHYTVPPLIMIGRRIDRAFNSALTAVLRFVWSALSKVSVAVRDLVYHYVLKPFFDHMARIANDIVAHASTIWRALRDSISQAIRNACGFVGLCDVLRRIWNVVARVFCFEPSTNATLIAYRMAGSEDDIVYARRAREDAQLQQAVSATIDPRHAALGEQIGNVIRERANSMRAVDLQQSEEPSSGCFTFTSLFKFFTGTPDEELKTEELQNAGIGHAREIAEATLLRMAEQPAGTEYVRNSKRHIAAQEVTRMAADASGTMRSDVYQHTFKRLQINENVNNLTCTLVDEARIVSSRAPNVLQPKVESHNLAASHRQVHIAEVARLIKMHNPSVLILGSPSPIRECFNIFRSDDLMIVVLQPTYSTADGIATSRWLTYMEGDGRIKLVCGDDALIHNYIRSETHREALSHAAKHDGRPMIYSAVDVGYYTVGHEFCLLRPGDLAINSAIEFNDYTAALRPMNFFCQAASTTVGVLGVQMYPTGTTDAYVHSTGSTTNLTSGVIVASFKGTLHGAAFALVDVSHNVENRIAGVTIHRVLEITPFCLLGATPEECASLQSVDGLNVDAVRAKELIDASSFKLTRPQCPAIYNDVLRDLTTLEDVKISMIPNHRLMPMINRTYIATNADIQYLQPDHARFVCTSTRTLAGTFNPSSTRANYCTATAAQTAVVEHANVDYFRAPRLIMASPYKVTNVRWCDIGVWKYQGKEYLFVRANGVNERMWDMTRYIMYTLEHAYDACVETNYLNRNDLSLLFGRDETVHLLPLNAFFAEAARYCTVSDVDQVKHQHFSILYRAFFTNAHTPIYYTAHAVFAAIISLIRTHSLATFPVAMISGVSTTALCFYAMRGVLSMLTATIGLKLSDVLGLTPVDACPLIYIEPANTLQNLVGLHPRHPVAQLAKIAVDLQGLNPGNLDYRPCTLLQYGARHLASELQRIQDLVVVERAVVPEEQRQQPRARNGPRDRQQARGTGQAAGMDFVPRGNPIDRMQCAGMERSDVPIYAHEPLVVLRSIDVEDVSDRCDFQRRYELHSDTVFDTTRELGRDFQQLSPTLSLDPNNIDSRRSAKISAQINNITKPSLRLIDQLNAPQTAWPHPDFVKRTYAQCGIARICNGTHMWITTNNLSVAYFSLKEHQNIARNTGADATFYVRTVTCSPQHPHSHTLAAIAIACAGLVVIYHGPRARASAYALISDQERVITWDKNDLDKMTDNEPRVCSIRANVQANKDGQMSFQPLSLENCLGVTGFSDFIKIRARKEFNVDRYMSDKPLDTPLTTYLVGEVAALVALNSPYMMQMEPDRVLVGAVAVYSDNYGTDMDFKKLQLRNDTRWAIAKKVRSYGPVLWSQGKNKHLMSCAMGRRFACFLPQVQMKSLLREHGIIDPIIVNMRSGKVTNMVSTPKFCVAVCIATHLERFTKVIRGQGDCYTAHFADPIAWLEANTTIDLGGFTNGVSDVNLQSIALSKPVVKIDERAFVVQFQVFTDQYSTGAYGEITRRKMLPQINSDNCIVVPLFFGPCETIGEEMLHSWLIASRDARFEINELSNLHYDGPEQKTNLSFKQLLKLIDDVDYQPFPYDCCCGACYPLPRGHNDALLRWANGALDANPCRSCTAKTIKMCAKNNADDDYDVLPWYIRALDSRDAVLKLIALQAQKFSGHCKHWQQTLQTGSAVVINAGRCHAAPINGMLKLVHRDASWGLRSLRTSPTLLREIQEAVENHKPRIGTWVRADKHLIKGAHTLESTCLSPTLNHLRPDIYIQKCTFSPCLSKRGAVTQVAPVFDSPDWHLRVSCKCTISQLNVISRLAAGNVVPMVPIVEGFLRFAEKIVASELTSIEATDFDAMNAAGLYMLEHQTIPASTKQRIKQEYDDALIRFKLTASAKMHLKTEALPNDFRSRPILHHNDATRFLCSGAYEHCSQQIYNSKHMIKKQTSQQIADHMVSLASRYQYVAVSDYSQFDGSQRTVHGKLEQIYVRRICGEQWARIWKFCFGQALLIEASNITFAAPYQLYSGKLSTSLTNTYLNELMLRYAFSNQGLIVGKDCDFLVEGDDNIIFANDKSHIENAIQWIRLLGFDTKSEFYDCLDDIEFVGIRVFRHDELNFVYRDPVRVFRRLGVAANSSCAYNPKLLASVLIGKSVSLIASLGVHETIVEIAMHFARTAQRFDHGLTAIVRKLTTDPEYVDNILDLPNRVDDKKLRDRLSFAVRSEAKYRVFATRVTDRARRHFRDFLDAKYGDDFRRYLRACQHDYASLLPRKEYPSLTSTAAQKSFDGVVFMNIDPQNRMYELAGQSCFVMPRPPIDHMEPQYGQLNMEVEPHTSGHSAMQQKFMQLQVQKPTGTDYATYDDLITAITGVDDYTAMFSLVKSGTVNPGRFALIREQFERSDGSRLWLACILVTASTVDAIASRKDLFKIIAEKALVFHPSPDYVRSLDVYGRQAKRSILRPFTAHNQKMGFNWRLTGNAAHFAPIEKGSRFPKTNYMGFLLQAMKFCPSLTNHFQEVVQMMSKAEVPIETIQQQVVVPQAYNQAYAAKGSERDSDSDTDDTVSVYSRQTNRAGEDYTMNRNTPGVTIGDVHKAMMTLPDIMSAVADQIVGTPDREWALSVISPFHAASKGARIPCYQPTQTVTGTNFQDYDFSVQGYSCLVATCFTAYNVEPWVILNNIGQSTLDAAPFAIDVWGNSQEPGIDLSTVVYSTRAIALPYVNNAQFLQQVTFGVIPNVTGLFTNVRVAAGGVRFFKTSASTTESGVIKAYYSDRGAYIARNLNQQLNYFQDDQSHVRVYCAAGAGEAMGRAGFMLGAIYQPLDNGEATTFSNQNRLFLSDYTGLMDANWLSQPQTGPIRILFQSSTAPYIAGRYYVLNKTSLTQIQTNQIQTTGFFFDVNSFALKHVTLSSFESVQADTTFEMQWVVHYEGVPSSESQYLETHMAILDAAYSSPMDILRKFDFADFRTGPLLNIDDPKMETASGIFQRGFFQKAGNALHKGIESIRRDVTLREKLKNLAPAIAGAIVKRVPGGQVIAPIVQSQLQNMLNSEGGNASGDISRLYRVMGQQIQTQTTGQRIVE